MIEDDFYPPGSLAGRAMQALRRPETVPGRPSWKGLQVVLRVFRYVGTERDDPMGSQTGDAGAERHRSRSGARPRRPRRGGLYGSFHSGSSFHWFQAAPAEWSALGDWWTAAVEAVEGALVAAGHPRAPDVV